MTKNRLGSKASPPVGLFSNNNRVMLCKDSFPPPALESLLFLCYHGYLTTKLHSPEWQVKQLHCAFSACKNNNNNNKKRNDNCRCCVYFCGVSLSLIIYHQIKSTRASWCRVDAAVCCSGCESETPTAVKKQEWTRRGLFFLMHSSCNSMEKGINNNDTGITASLSL